MTRPHFPRRVRQLGGGALLVLALAACGPGGDDGGGGDDRTLDVLAASSLEETFNDLAQTFEEQHPGVQVRLVLESSTTLANQVDEGAPADVLATADETSMQLVLDAGNADQADVFATNHLVLVTPEDNPAQVRSLADLNDAAVSYVACVDTAPCGALAEQLLAENAVLNDPRSLEVDVKAVLAKVTSGEADAGLVYASDARAAGSGVRTFPIPGAEQARNTYALTVVDQSDDADLARDWVDLVLSSEGRQVLRDAGFGPADPSSAQ